MGRPTYQFSPFLVLGLLLPLLVDVGLEAVDGVAPDDVLRVEHLHQVVDVQRGQPQRLDLGQLGVARHVRDAVPQRGERVVDRLRPPSLLLVAAHTLRSRVERGRRRGRRGSA